MGKVAYARSRTGAKRIPLKSSYGKFANSCRRDDERLPSENNFARHKNMEKGNREKYVLITGKVTGSETAVCFSRGLRFRGTLNLTFYISVISEPRRRVIFSWNSNERVITETLFSSDVHARK